MAQTAWQIWIKKSLFFFQAKNSLNILGLLCRFEEITIFIILPSKKLLKYTGFFAVPEWNKRLWLISKVYKKRFLRPVKILYFCLGWVEILMTPLESILLEKLFWPFTTFSNYLIFFNFRPSVSNFQKFETKYHLWNLMVFFSLNVKHFVLKSPLLMKLIS